MIKALFVTHCNDLSGANKSFVGIIENLKDKMEIVVLCNSRVGKLSEYLEEIGIEVLFADYSWWYIKPRRSASKQLYRRVVDTWRYKRSSISKKFQEVLKKYNFNCVYTNTSTVDEGAKIAERLQIPHVWHVREYGKEDFEFIPILPQQKQGQYFEQAYKIIVISEALRRKYQEYVSADRLIRIYNGLPIKQLLGEPGRGKRKDDQFNVLIAGQVCSGKGQEQAILAVQQLRNCGRNIDLYVAGDVDDSYLNPILKQLDPTQQWLHIMGMCKDMYSLRNAIDIELVCSRSEAFGRVTLEAMLHGIPVVGSRTGGTPELIEHGVTGMLYGYGNVNELAACIKVLMDDEKMYNSISSKAKEFASEFTIQRTAKQVYNVLIEAGGMEGCKVEIS